MEGLIDVLVEFDKNGVPGLLGISRIERELSQIFEGNRREDLRGKTQPGRTVVGCFQSTR